MDIIRQRNQRIFVMLIVFVSQFGFNLKEYQPKNDQKYALIFGNEVNGISDEAMQLIDACIEIPQFGTKHSFNIVVSAGIVLWDFFAKLNLR